MCLGGGASFSQNIADIRSNVTKKRVIGSLDVKELFWKDDLYSILFQGYINYEDSCPTNGINQMNVRPYESSRSRSTYVAGTRVAYNTIVCSN